MQTYDNGGRLASVTMYCMCFLINELKECGRKGVHTCAGQLYVRPKVMHGCVAGKWAVEGLERRLQGGPQL